MLVLTVPYDSVCNLSKSCPWLQCRQVSWGHCLHGLIILLLANESETWLFCESCFVSTVLTGVGRLNNFYFCCQLHEKIRSVYNKKNTMLTWFSNDCILTFNAECILEIKVQVFLLFYSVLMSGLGLTSVKESLK